MQLQGVKIQHFITGSVAMIWFLPILMLIFSSIINNDELAISMLPFPFPIHVEFILIPLAYFLGMATDYLGQVLLQPISNLIEKKYYSSVKTDMVSQFKNSSILTYVAAHNAALYRGIEVKQTQYEMARAFLLNLLGGLIIYATLRFTQNAAFVQWVPAIPPLILFGGFILFISISYQMWLANLKAYYKQQLYAMEFLERFELRTKEDFNATY